MFLFKMLLFGLRTILNDHNNPIISKQNHENKLQSMPQLLTIFQAASACIELMRAYQTPNLWLAELREVNTVTPRPYVEYNSGRA